VAYLLGCDFVPSKGLAAFSSIQKRKKPKADLGIFDSDSLIQRRNHDHEPKRLSVKASI
jgi:hypothetical protein